MSRIVIAIVIIYPIMAAVGGAAALLVTLWAYNTDARMLSDTVTAAVINTAAVVAASGFVGGFEMILSLWQFMRNQEAEQARQQERLDDKERWEQERAQQEQERQQERARQEQERQQERARQEQERVQREQERARQEQERARQEQERADDRKAMQAMQAEFMAQLRAEGERNAILTAKVLELSELAINRAAAHPNGNGGGNGNSIGNADDAPGPPPPANHSA